jgi:DNA-directed RNA polymerase II subunit RPB2
MKKMKSNKKTKGGSIDSLSEDDIFKITDLYFSQENILYSHQIDSFNYFLDEAIPNILKNGNNIFYDKTDEEGRKIISYSFRYSNIRFRPPTLDNNDYMFPSDARERNLTYGTRLVADVEQIQTIEDINSLEITKKVIGLKEPEVPLGLIPVCIKSKFCNLVNKSSKNNEECKYDPGAYYIVNGSEKLVLSLERMVDNKPFIFYKKESSYKSLVLQINSKSVNYNGMLQITSLKILKNKTIIIQIPIFATLPIFVVFRALGVESDRDIINYIVQDKNDLDMINFLRASVNNSVTDDTKEKILNHEDAEDYVITKMKIINRHYSSINNDLKLKQKKLHLQKILKNNFLPHVGNNKKDKIYYLGYLVNRLISCKLGRISVSDRDSYLNKRIDLPGKLLEDLFRQYYKKLISECRKTFKKRMGGSKSDDDPVNVINSIKPNIIEQGLKAALLTGSWGKKKGVAQRLERLTYLNTIVSLRRVNAPTVDASTNKLTSPRHLHSSQVGFICPVETPEGIKVGLVKHLSMIGNITIPTDSNIIIDYIEENTNLIKLQDIHPLKLFDKTKIFLNGRWLGIIEKGYELYLELKDKKLKGAFSNTIGIVFNPFKLEINIYTDGGRLFRPALIVENNKLKINKTHISNININNNEFNTNKLDWNTFIMSYPGLIENIDIEESSEILMAINQSKLLKINNLKNNIKNIKNTNNIILNRYDEQCFVNYTHCEIHPSLLMGMVVNNIPFCNHNQAPRNIFQFSQAKQAMGIYTSSYKHRLDISHILYNTQRPLVSTKTMKYTNADKLPSGENIIVAIMCYTGYNQEDSVIINKSAIDRGLFRSSTVKKYNSTIQKNQNTSADDEFAKPDPNKVTGIRYGSYDKLNEMGYTPEETKIQNGDIIIGKITPIKTTGNNKKEWKDSSEFYKSGVPGTVDKVYTGIINSEGFEVRKMRIRSMRVPRIGDKFCSRHGQKGTIGLILPQSDMPFTKNGITPDLIMNPNAIPSRMTVGQLVEALLAKICALMGVEGDGTPFRTIDIESLKKQLENFGYDGNGEEYLYNGMTGKKLKCKIFICPTYYQRLKHMVMDKEHSRPRGPVTLLTRQPPEGRSRDGGLRFGEMERDCVISHGMSKFLKERMVDTADAYMVHVCNTCGYFAQRKQASYLTPYGNNKDIFECKYCMSNNVFDYNIYKIQIPYAFKLLIQELMSLNIMSKIKLKEYN